MRTLSFLTAATVCLGGTALAQAPPPAAELAPYKAMVGHWEGSGTATMAPGMTGEWTATMDVAPILGGHFFQEDLKVSMGPAGEYKVRTIYGWDSENQRHIQFGTDTDGATYADEAFWHGDTLVSSGTRDDESSGNVITSRNTSKIADGEWKITIRNSIADGEEWVFVEGTFERKAERPTAVDASAPKGTLGEEIAPLRPMIGEWELTGKVLIMPGAPMMDISGKETVAPVISGNALMGKVEGQPMNYSEIWMLWPENGGYRLVAANNFGECYEAQGRLSDGGLSLVRSGTHQGGQLLAQRWRIEMADGAVTKATAHAFFATGEAHSVFEASYKRAE